MGQIVIRIGREAMGEGGSRGIKSRGGVKRGVLSSPSCGDGIMASD